MPKPSLQNQISDLDAKVTALMMLVESLYVDGLSETPDPARIGEAIVRSFLEAEDKVRQALGESDHNLRISEAASSLIDRAVQRVLTRRSTERPD